MIYIIEKLDKKKIEEYIYEKFVLYINDLDNKEIDKKIILTLIETWLTKNALKKYVKKIIHKSFTMYEYEKKINIYFKEILEENELKILLKDFLNFKIIITKKCKQNNKIINLKEEFVYNEKTKSEFFKEKILNNEIRNITLEIEK